MSDNVTKLLLPLNKGQHFHQRLRLIREARGMSQSDLARASGVDQSHIAHFESGRRKPSLDNFRALVLGLRCTADYLLLDIQHCDFEDGYRRGAFDAVEAMKSATMNMHRGIRDEST